MLAVIGNDTFLYRLVFLLHILSALVAFAPAFVWPVLNARARKSGRPVPAEVSGPAAVAQMTVHGPALVATGVFGILMVVLSTDTVGGEKLYEFSQAWISIAFVLWFALLGVVFGLAVPTERKAAAGDADAARKVPMFTGITHLLLLVMLVVMIWKPGFP